MPYLKALDKDLKAAGMSLSKKNIVMINGRVRAGYEIGNVLFAKAKSDRPETIVHIIGERPGSGHHNFSVYIASPKAKVWQAKKVDHDIVRVISGISNTSLDPVKAAAETVRLIKKINARD